MAKWLNICSNDFDRTVRRIADPDKEMRFNAGETGLYCYKCTNIMPLEECSKCGGKEYETDTYTGNIGLYCKKCKKGFDHFACTCGEVSWIDSIHLRQKAPPNIIAKLFLSVAGILIFPFNAVRSLLHFLIIRPSAYISRALKNAAADYERKRQEKRSEYEADKQFRADATKWTDIYYQPDPGWIGSGFPLRAMGELKCAAEKGNKYALKALENIFFQETDEGKKAEAAEYLKQATGRDYMPPDELRIKLQVHRMRPVPLPEQPEDLP